MKAGLFAGASMLALGSFGMVPAQAFDNVHWTWNAAVNERVTKTVSVNIDLDPTGMVMLEDLQIQIGNVSATSEVHNITNDPPQQNTQIPPSLAVQWHYGLGGALLNDGFKSPEVSAASVDETDVPPSVNGTVTATIDLSQLIQGTPLDAPTQLPSVVSAATAVGNNVNITTDNPVELHEGQFLTGDIGTGDGLGPVIGDALSAYLVANNFGSVNSNLLLAGAGLIQAASGNLSKALITATSDVTNITNATVDGSATAVGNNLNVAIAAGTPNALLIGDATQFAYADVTARSRVNDVTISNYLNLGSPLNRPIVSSVATAVGNNKSINVSVPTP
jgi:hypothetical protein